MIHAHYGSLYRWPKCDLMNFLIAAISRSVASAKRAFLQNPLGHNL